MGMGYQGFAKFFTSGPSTGPMVVLATGASVNLVLEPIYSTAVWGAGWYNAAEAAHYADNALRYEGNIDVELQMGAAGGFWDFMSKFIVASRAYPRSLEISPDGSHLYSYLTTGAYNANYDTHGAWCKSANFSTSETIPLMKPDADLSLAPTITWRKRFSPYSSNDLFIASVTPSV